MWIHSRILSLCAACISIMKLLGRKKWYWYQKEVFGFSLCAGSLQRPAVKPLDFNRMLCRRLVVIMSQQIPACRDTWVEGGRVCVQLVSPQGSFISRVLSHVGQRYGIYTDVCLCVFAAYLFHTLHAELLWSQLGVKGNLLSAKLPLQAQTCASV